MLRYLVRIVLVAQGDLVKSLLETAVLIAGELDQIEAVSFDAEERAPIHCTLRCSKPGRD
jgi:hypothetical protein